MPADGRNGPSSVAADTLGVPENESRTPTSASRREPRGYIRWCIVFKEGPVTVCDTTHTVERVNYHVRSISDVHNRIVS